MNRVPKTRAGGTMTEAGFMGFIRSMLRKGSTRWKPKYDCKKKARLPEKLPNAKGRLVFHSKCSRCEGVFPETETKVDHIEPVVDPDKGFTSWDEFIERLFCEEEGLQVLCNPCHDEKSEEENKIRRNKR